MNHPPLPGLPAPRRWLVLPAWGVLHRVSAIEWSADHDETQGQGVTCCGRSGVLAMPGVFSRIGLPRCKRCCKVAGVPEGNGAPFNHDIEEKVK